MKFVLTLIAIWLTTGLDTEALEFSEVSFNEQNDWIKLNTTEGSAESYGISDDTLITTITAEELEGIEYVLIYFNSTPERYREDTTLYIHLSKKGLTATTEQLVLTEDGEIIEVVCWKKDPIAISEAKDMEELAEYLPECIESAKVKKGVSIAKVEDIWQIMTPPNAPPEADITVQKGSTKGQHVPFSLNLDGSSSYDPDGDTLTYEWSFPDEEFTQRNPPSYRFTKEGTHTITLTVTDPSGAQDTTELLVEALPATPKAKKSKSRSTGKKSQNGDLSSAIRISEIYPNPAGKDTGQEWIELYNLSTVTVNLGNWTLQTEKGTKSTLKDTVKIPGKSHIVLSKQELRFALKNSGDTLTLRDFAGETVDQITYTEAREGLSYSHATLEGETPRTEWRWSVPTPGEKNPRFITLIGVVETPPTVESEYYLTLNEEGTLHHIVIDEMQMSFKTAAAALKKGMKVKTLVEKAHAGTLTLQEFQIYEQPVQAEESTQKGGLLLLFVAPALVGAGALGYLYFRRPLAFIPK